MTEVQVGKSISKALLDRDASWRNEIISARQPFMAQFLAQSETESKCPACHSETEISKFSSPNGATFLECYSCSHLFSIKAPSRDFLEDYYGSRDSSQIKTYVAPTDEVMESRQKEIARPKARFISDIFLKTGGRELSSRTWADVGCGIGDLLVEAAGLQFVPVGFETDESQVRVARSRGIPVIQEFLEPGSPSFNSLQHSAIVSMINVLEHVPHPVKILTEISNVLGTGAYLALEVPRNPSLSSIVQRAEIAPIFRHLSPPEHLHIFSDDSLDLMLEKSGFSVLGRWCFGSDALEIFSAVSAQLGRTGNFRDPDLELAINRLQLSIDRSGLSDTQLVVARKVK